MASVKAKGQNATEMDFEAALNELEKVVTELDGEIKLERALELFDQGMTLSIKCEKFLKTAEQKIEILKRNTDGTLSTEPFEKILLDIPETE